MGAVTDGFEPDTDDPINENYAYDYKNLQQKVFDAMRSFFGEDVPINTQ